MLIKTSDIKSIKSFLKHFYLPKPDSHKGQSGKILVIGGSKLFHSASLWAAEIASHIMDMVHYSSTQENGEIFLSLKKKFRNGIIVLKKDIPAYVEEDDVILVGPGMIRGRVSSKFKVQSSKFSGILKIEDEATYAFYLTKYLVEHFPNKKFVFDAGALQMMRPEWLLKLKTKPILTPHQGEFKQLFGIQVEQYSVKEKANVVKKMAKKYNCVILLKAIVDFISDGSDVIIVEGGNAGLTKGGTGDILAGLTSSFFAKNSQINSAILASYILKKTAEELFNSKGYWYNINDIIELIPKTLKQLIYKE